MAFFSLILLAFLPLRAGDSCDSGKTIQICEGSVLTYEEFGARHGKPVFYFHGLNGSRLEALLIDEEARHCGIRLIAVDRPGIGGSTFYEERMVKDWACDFEKLVHALGLGHQKVGIFAVSGGSPYACAVASEKPYLISRVNLVSPFAPFSSLVEQKSIVSKQVEIVSKRTNLAKAIFKKSSKTLEKNPDRFLKQFTKNWYGKDIDLLMQNRVNQIRNMRQVQWCGPAGVVKDIELHTSEWCIDYQKIHPCVTIWAGDADPIAPLNMARFYRDRISGSYLRVGKGEGHVTMVKNYANEIFSKY